MRDTLDVLRAECADLDSLVAGVAAADWARPTPAAGWTIAHQIAHLAWTDEVALLTATGSADFGRVLQEATREPRTYVDRMAAEGASRPPSELLDRWRTARAALADALASADPSTRIAWFGPPMSPRSMSTARLMETWAHGQDVADALGVRREPTDRLRDIAHLGVRTRDFAYAINGLTPPETEFRIELTGPSGDAWTWGPPDAEAIVRGSAEDFCLVVVQRREASATSLRATGEAAHWLTFAQVFAGRPTRAVAR